MAQQSGWNPEIQDTDIPYYGRLSHPISKIPAQQSVAPSPGAVSGVGTGDTLAGVGNIISGAAKVTDELYTQNLLAKTEETFGPKVRQHVADVEDVRDAVYGGKQASTATVNPMSGKINPPEVAGSTPSDVPPSQLPQSAKAGFKRISDLTTFRDSGRVSETNYKGEVDKIASEVRAQIPVGYRSTFDRMVAEVTGIPHTANAYVQSMIGDINDLVAHNRAERDKTRNKIMDSLKYGPQMVDLLQRYDNGQLDEYTALKEVSKYAASDHSVEQAKSRLALSTASDEANRRDALRIVGNQAQQSITNRLETILDGMGFHDIKDNPDKMLETMKSLNPEQAQMLVVGMKAAAIEIAEDTRKFANMPQKPSPNNPEGKSLFQLYGLTSGDLANASKDAQQFAEFWEKHLTGENGATTAATRALKAISENTQTQMLEDKDIGSHLKVINALEKLMGSQALGVFFNVSQFRELGTKLQDFIPHMEEKAQKSLLPGRNVYEDVKNSVDTARKNHFSDNDIGVIASTYLKRPKELFNNPAFKPPEKEKFVDYFYGPKTAGMIANLTDRNGSYYSTFYDPSITAQVKKLGGQAWETYKNRAEFTFSSEVAVPLLSKLGNMANDPAIKITYDDEHNSFNYDMGDIKSVVGNTKRGIAHPYDTVIDDLNRAYRAASVVAKADDKNPKDYAFSIFQALSPNDKVASMFAEAIKASRQPPKIGIPIP